MFFVTLIMLLLLGLLGIAPWLKARNRSAKSALRPLEGAAGWVGLVGLVWGLYLLLSWIGYIGLLQHAPGSMLLSLLIALLVCGLSLLLVSPLLQSLLGKNGFTNVVAGLSARLATLQVALGASCLVLALVVLLRAAF